MTNQPQRALAKKSVRLNLDSDLYHATRILAAKANCSMSSIIESVLLLSKLIYSQDSDDSFIYELRDLKVHRLASLSDLRNGAAATQCHLTIDREAVDFAQMLYRTYRPVFRSTQEAVALCLAWAQHHCESEEELRRFLRRLESTQLVFPKRKKGTP